MLNILFLPKHDSTYMHVITDEIQKLFGTYSTAHINSIDKLPQAGSERHYFRLHTSDGDFIATYGANIPENETFIYFSHHFTAKQLCTARTLCVSADKSLYIQEDFGNVSLIDHLAHLGFNEKVSSLYQQSLNQLALLQVKGHEGLDYKKCLTNSSFGKEAIMADLLYFKYYFLDALRRPYDKQLLIDDFEALSNYLTHTEYKYFMFRDFQSRNILVKEASPSGRGLEGALIHFIDYQGGMKGAPQYDVASMLWQARANLPDEWKENLLVDYMNAFENLIGSPLERNIFRSQYNGYVLIRLLQVLGAYGFRGLFERKAQFLTSIPLALKNLKWFFENQSLGIAVPEFGKVLSLCVRDDVVEHFTPLQANEQTPLVVKICSFSYRKGIPQDNSENGGGFV